MKIEDIEIYKALKYNHDKNYWYYLVPTNVRRSGEMKVSIKKYHLLKSKYESLLITKSKTEINNI